MSTSTHPESHHGFTGYSVPQESKNLLVNGVIENPLIKSSIPKDARSIAEKVTYNGSHAPSIPINWRFAESVSALKGLEAVMIIALLKQKYNVDVEEVSINTDHAQLFFMSTLLWTLDPDGENIPALAAISAGKAEKLATYFPNWDKSGLQATPHRMSCTNIYETKDGRYFHLHGSMNPDPSLESIGLPHNQDSPSMEASWKPFQDRMIQIDSTEMQRLASDVYQQAGTICWTTEEYKQSEHGKANAHVGLFEIREHPNEFQTPCWWVDSPQTSSQRPLAGLKVVDITRVIAAPAISRGLAELGASVMRVTAPHLNDYSSLHCDLNWGKWNCCLDFRKEEDYVKLKNLILEADVVVTGYRPHVLDKWGIGEEGILEMCKHRGKGVVYARENCYGWNGPWSYRSGWQQISDANCGVSMEFGRAMGNDEPVTPVYPNSDYCTGIAGVSGILQALMLRASKGGSYSVDVALNYYSQWLVNSCGVYPADVKNALWSKNGNPVFRHYHNMLFTIPKHLAMIEEHSKGILFKEEYFEDRICKNLGIKIRAVKPILNFKAAEVELAYNVGTRTNGVDQARWPKDLISEIVS